jgi:LysM repeat protein
MYRRVLGSLAPLAALTGLLALSACGDDDADATLPSYSIAPESYVTRPPATTTTTIPLEDIKPGEASPQEQIYEVQSGDYLAGIAAKYEVSAEEIANYNDFPNGVNELIVPGQEIKIPPNAVVPAEEADETTTTPLAGENLVTTTDDGSATDDSTEQTTGDNCGPGKYALQAGDYPIGVAKKFDVTVDALAAANADTPGYSAFYPGLEIVIPAKSNCN